MNRVHVVTLGVRDMNRAIAFYRDGLGFETMVEEENPPIVFFQSDGVTLALCPRDGMAKDIDQENPPQGEGFAGVTLACVAREVWAVEFSGAPPRGAEYSVAEMDAAGARLSAYRVEGVVCRRPPRGEEANHEHADRIARGPGVCEQPLLWR